MGAQQTVVLDSSNTEAVIADALGESPKAETPAEKPVEAAPEALDKGAKTNEADDIEGEDGLTPRQKREFTDAMQKTIAKKHRLQKEAEEFAADQYNQRRLAEQRAEELEREATQLKNATQPAKPKEISEPVRENFKSDQEYFDARADWRAEVRFKELQDKALEERQQQVIANAANAVTRAKELVPDYAEKTGAADYMVPIGVQTLMLESPLFAEIGYHFADHPEDMARLVILPPERLKVEFRKLESIIQPFGPADGTQKSKANGNGTEKPSQQPSTETGNAPEAPAPSKPRVAAPIKPLSAGTSSQVEKPPHERTLEDEKLAFQRRNNVNLSARKRH